MKPLSEDDRLLLASLQNAVREALDRKRRLGQYAVVWKDGHPAYIGPNAPASPGRSLTESMKRRGGAGEPGGHG